MVKDLAEGSSRAYVKNKVTPGSKWTLKFYLRGVDSFEHIVGVTNKAYVAE